MMSKPAFLPHHKRKESNGDLVVCQGWSCPHPERKGGCGQTTLYWQ